MLEIDLDVVSDELQLLIQFMAANPALSGCTKAAITGKQRLNMISVNTRLFTWR